MDCINQPKARVRLATVFDMAQDFIDAWRAPSVPGEDGLAAVTMVEVGYRSSEPGQAVELT